MASTQEYRDYILDQLTGLEGISCRAMMGEYLLYCQGKLVGGIYDNRLLVKPTASAVRLLPDAPRELPYDCLLYTSPSWARVEKVDRAFISTVFWVLTRMRSGPLSSTAGLMK